MLRSQCFRREYKQENFPIANLFFDSSFYPTYLIRQILNIINLVAKKHIKAEHPKLINKNLTPYII